MIKKAEYLPDFYTNTGRSQNWGEVVQLVGWDSSTGTTTNQVGGKPAKVEKKEKPKITPKRLFELKALNNSFALNTDPKHVDEQISTFKDKLSLYKDKDSDYRGVNEISSILCRLENRKKYPKSRKFYEEFPYTTTERIDRLVKQHDHLKLGEVSQFLADMPKEAVDVMKSYTKETQEVSGKKPIFYIIAPKADFEKTQKRRDPILLAQSPFAHVWQILGAWDKEMVLVEEL